MNSLPKIFALYLKTKNITSVTRKNYLSDLSHFLGWITLYLQTRNIFFSPEEPRSLLPHFNLDLVRKYKAYLLSNEIPPATVNRRLSTLRVFASFCQAEGWISQNPTKEIPNVGPGRRAENRKQSQQILEKFRKYLEKENNRSNTIKSYLSDIRGFLAWLEIAT